MDLICVSGFGRTTKQEDLEAAFNKCEGVAKVTLSDGGKVRIHSENRRSNIAIDF